VRPRFVGEGWVPRYRGRETGDSSLVGSVMDMGFRVFERALPRWCGLSRTDISDGFSYLPRVLQARRRFRYQALWLVI